MNDNRDILLHFNPRFEGQNVIVRNSKQNDQWGKEERQGAMPLTKGGTYEITIFNLEKHFCVSNYSIVIVLF